MISLVGNSPPEPQPDPQLQRTLRCLFSTCVVTSVAHSLPCSRRPFDRGKVREMATSNSNSSGEELRDACQNADEATVKQLLKESVDINSCDKVKLSSGC